MERTDPRQDLHGRLGGEPVSYPRHRLARAHKFVTITAGSSTVSGTTWADLPTIAATADLTLAAQVGDTVELGMSLSWTTGATYGAMTVATIVSAAAVNHVQGWTSTTGGNGVKAWMQTGNVSSDAGLGGAVLYTLVAGDISAGTVTFRPRARILTASTKVMNATAVDPFHFYAKNLGPVDPN